MYYEQDNSTPNACTNTIFIHAMHSEFFMCVPKLELKNFMEMEGTIGLPDSRRAFSQFPYTQNVISATQKHTRLFPWVEIHFWRFSIEMASNNFFALQKCNICNVMFQVSLRSKATLSLEKKVPAQLSQMV